MSSWSTPFARRTSWRTAGSKPNEARHYRVLRQIALDYPPLTRAVWRLLGDANTHRRWDAVVRADAS